MTMTIGSTATVATVRRRKRRFPFVILLCLLVIVGLATLAATGSLLAPQDPGAQNLTNSLAKPSSDHLLGTDQLGQDVLSRLIAGARIAIVGPLIIAVGSALIGNVLGLIAGYKGGRIDGLIMRWIDLMLAIPSLLVLVVVAGSLGGGYWLVVALLTFLSVPVDARVVRAATLEQTPRAYVESARTLGLPTWRILGLHIWPNVSGTAIANALLGFATALTILSGVSFLGLGAPPSSPDWGVTLSQNLSLIFVNPMAVLAPGVVIVVLATSVNLVGDWVYERLTARGMQR